MKETLKIQYFVDFFSKQTNQTFFFLILIIFNEGWFFLV